MEPEQRLKHREKGMTAVEMAVGSFFFVVFTLLCADVAVLTLANGVNNEACRDAARAAGIAPLIPGMTAQQSALKAANLALKAHKRVDGHFLKNLQITNFVYNGNLQNNNTIDTTDPNKQPTVFVQTQLTVRLPAQINWFAPPRKKTELVGQHGDMSFQSSYLYPILNLEAQMPNDMFDRYANATQGYQTPDPLGQCQPAPPPCQPPPANNGGNPTNNNGPSNNNGPTNNNGPYNPPPPPPPPSPPPITVGAEGP